MVFQMMFAVITPALITGAFAERMSFKAFVFFTLLWATFVYNPIAHWVWSCTEIQGAAPVSQGARAAGLVARSWSPRLRWWNGGAYQLRRFGPRGALVLGKRLGFGEEPLEPHDGTMVVLGAAALVRLVRLQRRERYCYGRLATSAFVVTHVGAAMAAITWMTMSWVHKGPRACWAPRQVPSPAW